MTTKVKFVLPSEIVANASEGFLLGEFNDWNHAEGVKLQKKKDGSMVAEIALIAGRSYQYRYFLNDGRWVNDNNGTTSNDVYGYTVENCIVEVPVTVKAKAPTKAAVIKKVKEPKLAKLVADDLTKIEGIGKKIALLFKKAGIITYKDLAKSTVKTLKATLEAGGDQFNMHNPGSWPKQAKLAAAAKWDELAKLQEELNAGK